jgi:hypothetical protein
MEVFLPGLILNAQSQVTSETARSQGEWPDKFDDCTFHQHLLNFIITDNQVQYAFILSFYVYNAYNHVFRLSSLYILWSVVNLDNSSFFFKMI